MKDVWLDFCKRPDVRHDVKDLLPGAALRPDAAFPGLFLNEAGRPVLHLSKAFQRRLAHYQERGYAVERVTVAYIVVWQDQESGKEYRVALPEVGMLARCARDAGC